MFALFARIADFLMAQSNANAAAIRRAQRLQEAKSNAANTNTNALKLKLKYPKARTLCDKPLLPQKLGDAAVVKKKTFQPKLELHVKDVAEQLFGVEFKRCRPKWMLNPATGRRLECDLLNAELRL